MYLIIKYINKNVNITLEVKNIIVNTPGEGTGISNNHLF